MEIPEIKAKLTLSAVIKYYGFKADKNNRINCPFHEDKTPSMQLYGKTHTAYCFSSNCKTHGKSMDVIDFILHKENSSKHAALLKAVEIIGYYEGKVTRKTVTADTPKVSAPAGFLQNMFTYFKNAVHNSKPAQAYIEQRGLNSNTLEIGYNSGQFHHGARKEETLINQCLEYGLLSKHDKAARTGEAAYKVFAKYCIVFAMRSKANQVTGLYFRSTVNDSEQKHFYLKDSTGLYPAYPKATTEKLIIAESIIDAASLLQIESIAKEYSIIAAYGTNRLNEEMITAITELKQLGEIVFAFDNDEAGNKAVVKYADELKALLPVVRISKIILPCKDVNETLIAHNEAVFSQLLKERTTDFFLSTENKNESGARLLIENPVEKNNSTLDTTNPYKLRYTTDTANYYIQGSLPKTTDNLKVMLVIESISTQLKARNRIDLYEDKQVEKLCKDVSEKLQLRKDLMEGDLYRLTDLLEQHIEKQLQTSDDGQPKTVLLTVKERSELEAFAKKPKLIKRLNDLLGKTGIVAEERNRILLFIVAASHIQKDTLHALIQGSSGSGKTKLLKQIADCMPKDKVRKYTRLSDKVLYNFPEFYFSNTIVFLEDADGLSEEAEFAHRELQSNGELSSAASIKLENGQIVAGEKIVKGPIASIACTTKGEVYEDNMSRVFLIAVDESAEKIKKVIEYQNSKAGGVIDGKEEQAAKTFIQNFMRLLNPCEVINPYYNSIYLPEDAHKILRLNEMFQTMIKTITMLNQYQRSKDSRGRLISEIEDIETAVHIMFESIVLKVDELDGSLRQFYEKLKLYINKKSKGYEFTRFEVMEATGVKKTQQHVYMNKLVELEYIQQNGFANRGFKYKIVHWDNYTALRERIKTHLTTQLEAIKVNASEHQRTPDRTPALAAVAG